MNKKLQGYKVTDNKRTKRCGVAANSLIMLKEKAAQKFKIKDVRIYLAVDGFEVSEEDYFQTIEPQTLFIAAEPDENIKSDSEFEYEQLKNNSYLLKTANVIYKLIDEQPEQFKKIIIDFEKNNFTKNTLTAASIKEEHEDWFKGLDARTKTKEEAMARRAQDRVRGYYYKAKEEVTKCAIYRKNLKAKKIIDRALEIFRYLLISCDYFSMLFNRKFKKKHPFLQDQLDASSLPNKKMRLLIKKYASKTELLNDWSVSLCTNEGDFYCQGLWDGSGSCKHNHKINPYTSRENLILFQVWNLDHQIEFSRAVIPSLIKNVEILVQNTKEKCPIHKKKFMDINIFEYFLELFSIKNLRLVHIVCHDKVMRNAKSNAQLICEDCKEYNIIKDFSNNIVVVD